MINKVKSMYNDAVRCFDTMHASVMSLARICNEEIALFREVIEDDRIDEIARDAAICVSRIKKIQAELIEIGTLTGDPLHFLDRFLDWCSKNQEFNKQLYGFMDHWKESESYLIKRVDAEGI